MLPFSRSWLSTVARGGQVLCPARAQDSSRGQRPRKTPPQGPTLKGSNLGGVTPVICSAAQGRATPSGSGERAWRFPGALPPATLSIPCGDQTRSHFRQNESLLGREVFARTRSVIQRCGCQDFLGRGRARAFFHHRDRGHQIAKARRRDGVTRYGHG